MIEIPVIAPADNGSWIAGEVAGCEFRDTRLGKRLSSFINLVAALEARYHWRQDWTNTKDAYRFFSNEEVDEKTILARR